MQKHISNSFSAFLVTCKQSKCLVNYPWQLETSLEVMLSQIRLMTGQSWKEEVVDDKVIRIQILSNYKKALSQNQFELRISATCRKVKGLNSYSGKLTDSSVIMYIPKPYSASDQIYLFHHIYTESK